MPEERMHRRKHVRPALHSSLDARVQAVQTRQPVVDSPFEIAAHELEQETGLPRDRWIYSAAGSEPAMIAVNERHVVRMRELAGLRQDARVPKRETPESIEHRRELRRQWYHEHERPTRGTAQC